MKQPNKVKLIDRILGEQEFQENGDLAMESDTKWYAFFTCAFFILAFISIGKISEERHKNLVLHEALGLCEGGNKK